MKATLALENGLVYEGDAAGAPGEASGEVVFNTSMTGYQEILTDPSYAGQIVTMTVPQVGNYGIADEDGESRGTQVAGFIVRDESPIASNWRADSTLREYLTRSRVVAISDIDTRALTRLLRSAGFEVLAQSLAADDLHREVHVAVGEARRVVDGRHAAVLDRRERVVLPAEALAVHPGAAPHPLERDLAAELAVVGEVHGAHVPGAELAKQVVAVEEALGDLGHGALLQVGGGKVAKRSRTLLRCWPMRGSLGRAWCSGQSTK